MTDIATQPAIEAERPELADEAVELLLGISHVADTDSKQENMDADSKVKMQENTDVEVNVEQDTSMMTETEVDVVRVATPSLDLLTKAPIETKSTTDRPVTLEEGVILGKVVNLKESITDPSKMPLEPIALHQPNACSVAKPFSYDSAFYPKSALSPNALEPDPLDPVQRLANESYQRESEGHGEQGAEILCEEEREFEMDQGQDQTESDEETHKDGHENQATISTLGRQKRKRSSISDPSRPAHYLGLENTVIRCICRLSEDDGFTIQCDLCGAWEHGMCFGYASVDEAPDQFICELCDPRPVGSGFGGQLRIEEARRGVLERVERLKREKNAIRLDAKGASDKPRSKGKKRRLDSNSHAAVPEEEMPPPNKPKRGRQPSSKTRPKPPQPSPSPYPTLPDSSEEYFNVDPWAMEFIPIKENIVRGMAVRAILRGLYKEWIEEQEDEKVKAISNPSHLPSPTETGLIRLSPDSILSPPNFSPLAPPLPPIFLTGPSLTSLASPLVIKAISPSKQPSSFLPPTYRSHLTMKPVYSHPAIYGLFTPSPLSVGSFLGEYLGEIVEPKKYRRDPINQYAGLGVLKTHVRAVGPPVNLLLDARAYGNELRFARSGCHPNAVLRPIVYRTTSSEQIVQQVASNGNVRHEARSRVTATAKLQWGLFVSHPIPKNGEILLGWEWDDNHLVHSLSLLSPTITSSGHCGIPLALCRRTSNSKALSAKQAQALANRYEQVLKQHLGIFAGCGCPPDSGSCAFAQMMHFWKLVQCYEKSEDAEAIDGGWQEEEKGIDDEKEKKADLGPLVGGMRGWRKREVEICEMKRLMLGLNGFDKGQPDLGVNINVDVDLDVDDRSIGNERRNSGVNVIRAALATRELDGEENIRSDMEEEEYEKMDVDHQDRTLSPSISDQKSISQHTRRQTGFPSASRSPPTSWIVPSSSLSPIISPRKHHTTFDSFPEGIPGEIQSESSASTSEAENERDKDEKQANEDGSESDATTLTLPRSAMSESPLCALSGSESETDAISDMALNQDESLKRHVIIPKSEEEDIGTNFDAARKTSSIPNTVTIMKERRLKEEDTGKSKLKKKHGKDRNGGTGKGRNLEVRDSVKNDTQVMTKSKHKGKQVVKMSRIIKSKEEEKKSVPAKRKQIRVYSESEGSSSSELEGKVAKNCKGFMESTEDEKSKRISSEAQYNESSSTAPKPSEQNITAQPESTISLQSQPNDFISSQNNTVLPLAAASPSLSKISSPANGLTLLPEMKEPTPMPEPPKKVSLSDYLKAHKFRKDKTNVESVTPIIGGANLPTSVEEQKEERKPALGLKQGYGQRQGPTSGLNLFEHLPFSRSTPTAPSTPASPTPATSLPAAIPTTSLSMHPSSSAGPNYPTRPTVLTGGAFNYGTRSSLTATPTQLGESHSLAVAGTRVGAPTPPAPITSAMSGLSEVLSSNRDDTAYTSRAVLDESSTSHTTHRISMSTPASRSPQYDSYDQRPASTSTITDASRNPRNMLNSEERPRSPPSWSRLRERELYSRDSFPRNMRGRDEYRDGRPDARLPPPLASRDLPPHASNYSNHSTSYPKPTPRPVGLSLGLPRAPPTGPKVPPNGPRFAPHTATGATGLGGVTGERVENRDRSGPSTGLGFSDRVGLGGRGSFVPRGFAPRGVWRGRGGFRGRGRGT
nr:hypothetical protein L204_01591 [Cryptococcus depauperatus CBS 7855]